MQHHGKCLQLPTIFVDTWKIASNPTEHFQFLIHATCSLFQFNWHYDVRQHFMTELYIFTNIFWAWNLRLIVCDNPINFHSTAKMCIFHHMKQVFGAILKLHQMKSHTKTTRTTKYTNCLFKLHNVEHWHVHFQRRPLSTPTI